MIARARLLSVLAIILGGAIAIISSTQPWLEVVLTAGAAEPISVPGASALTLLAPLSLAALALGLALTVVGRVLRYLFGAIAVAIGAVVLTGAVRVGLQHPVDAISAAVTEATGLSGTATIADLVGSITGTPWPFVTAVAALLIAAGGGLTLGTAYRWQSAGRRYRTDAPVGDASTAGSRPHDAIDSWDDLSHGDDPTAR